MAAAQTIPLKREVPEKDLVADFAETLAPQGYKVTGFTVKTDLEKEERTLSVSAKRSTADPQQESMDLRNGQAGERPRRKRNKDESE